MTSPSILHSLGYDDWGNNPDLLHPNDKAIIDGEVENGRYGKVGVPRAGGRADCNVCGYPLELHPKVQGALYFIRSCEGIVKL
ncbi:hypothetical protein LOF17_25875 [Sinorhizobium meliloti]|nr:hypothetical protein [Sinorhizobium meliloti]AEG53175.1 hypothetical protein Sinme_1430 [Sinorhizobium meliloti AK83]MDE4591109.1 hypothetical protein [Sinorhizobium meliloti]SEI56567.1 hypothetical protein SAMN04244575_01079 [Sinorhizobium meliloti]